MNSSVRRAAFNLDVGRALRRHERSNRIGALADILRTAANWPVEPAVIRLGLIDTTDPEATPFAGLRAGAGVRRIGERTNIANLDSLLGHALVDASISYDLARLDPRLVGFTASAFGTNLFDQRYFTAAFDPYLSLSNGRLSGSVFEWYRRAVYGQFTYRW